MEGYLIDAPAPCLKFLTCNLFQDINTNKIILDPLFVIQSLTQDVLLNGSCINVLQFQMERVVSNEDEESPTEGKRRSACSATFHLSSNSDSDEWEPLLRSVFTAFQTTHPLDF